MLLDCANDLELEAIPKRHILESQDDLNLGSDLAIVGRIIWDNDPPQFGTEITCPQSDSDRTVCSPTRSPSGSNVTLAKVVTRVYLIVPRTSSQPLPNRAPWNCSPIDPRW